MAPCGWCVHASDWLYQNVWVWMWTYITQWWTECTVQRCRWWCLCCNKWLCWIALIILTVLWAIVYAVIQVITFILCFACHLLCALVCLLPGILTHSDQCTNGCTGGPIGSGGTPPRTSGGPGPITTSGRRVADDDATGKAKAQDMADRRGPGGPVVITSSAALIIFSQWWRIDFLGRPALVEIAGLDRSASDVAQAAMDRRNAACGCLEGKIGVAVALAGYVIARYSSGYSAGWTVAITTAALCVVFGAVLGKTVGLIIAQVRLRRSISRISEIWISPSPEEP